MAKEKKEKGKLWKEFKAFINRGNAFNLAVGVVIGSAFNAIVTALTNILLSVCTWGVPGGLSGLVTVLPAVSDSQKGIEGIGQSFSNDSLAEMAQVYCTKMGGTYAGNEVLWQDSIKTLYTQHGNLWVYNQSAIIDWGTFINAIISFLIIAIVLFIIVKVVNSLVKANEELKAKALEEYYEKHPEERPVPPDPGKPEPTEKDLLNAILAELKKQNGTAPAVEAKPEVK